MPPLPRSERISYRPTRVLGDKVTRQNSVYWITQASLNSASKSRGAEMRIIAGLYKGRNLKSPPSMQVRPTSDRLRETLFNVIASRVQDSRFLDLCAGTGAVGIEALSRGASYAT